jgi:hypothetical protein
MHFDPVEQVTNTNVFNNVTYVHRGKKTEGPGAQQREDDGRPKP